MLPKLSALSLLNDIPNTHQHWRHSYVMLPNKNIINWTFINNIGSKIILNMYDPHLQKIASCIEHADQLDWSNDGCIFIDTTYATVKYLNFATWSLQLLSISTPCLLLNNHLLVCSNLIIFYPYTNILFTQKSAQLYSLGLQYLGAIDFNKAWITKDSIDNHGIYFIEDNILQYWNGIHRIIIFKLNITGHILHLTVHEGQWYILIKCLNPKYIHKDIYAIYRGSCDGKNIMYQEVPYLEAGLESKIKLHKNGWVSQQTKSQPIRDNSWVYQIILSHGADAHYYQCYAEKITHKQSIDILYTDKYELIFMHGYSIYKYKKFVYQSDLVTLISRLMNTKLILN